MARVLASPRTVEQLLAEARSRLTRLCPRQAFDALQAGALLIDIRSESQRCANGVVPGSSYVARNVLEWRLDPASAARDPALAQPGALIVLMCDEGYQSSLAAATLQELGLSRATDLEGGFVAWKADGLPVTRQVVARHE